MAAEDEPDGDDTASLVLRRCSTGIASCCEDRILGGVIDINGGVDIGKYRAELLSRVQEVETEYPRILEVKGDNRHLGGDRCWLRSIGRKEARDKFHGVFGAEEEIGHIGLGQQALVVKAPKPVTEEQHDEFPGPSPLRTLEQGDSGCSVLGIMSEMGSLLSDMFDSDQDKNEHEDAMLIVSSGLAADCPMVKINRDASETEDVHSCPQDASEDHEVTCVVESCEKSPNFEVENVQCSGKKLFANDGNRESNKFRLRNVRSLPLQYVGSHKEHCEDNISSTLEETSIYPQVLGEEGEVDRSVEGSPDEVCSCDPAEGLALLGKPTHLSMPLENFCLTLSSSPAFEGSEANALIAKSACRGNVNSFCGEADDGGRSVSKSSSINVLRRSNPKRGASLRSNLADVNFDQLSKTRKSRRNDKKTVDVSSTYLLSTIKISEKLKKKRSCPYRPAHASVWGAVANLIRIFKQNVKVANYYPDKFRIKKRRSKKVRSSVANQKQSKLQEDGCFRESSAKHSEISQQSVFQVILGLPADCHLNSDNFNEAEAEHKLAGDRFGGAVKSLREEVQLRGKEMESSLTQEASVKLGVLGVSSQMVSEMSVESISDRNLLDPGASPDSDVYHPVVDIGRMTNDGASIADQVIGAKNVGIMTSTGANSINQLTGMGQNVRALGPVSEDGLHSAVSTYSNAFLTPLSVPPLDPKLGAKAKKGKMNGRLSGKPCTLSEHHSIVEKLHGSECSKSKRGKQDDINKKNQACSNSIKAIIQNGSTSSCFPAETSVLEIDESECLEEPIEVKNGSWVCNSQLEASLQTDETKRHKASRGTKPGTCKGRSHCPDTEGRRISRNMERWENYIEKLDTWCSTRKRSQIVDASMEVSDYGIFSYGTVDPTLNMSTQENCKTNEGSRVVPEDVSSLVMTPVCDQLGPNESKSSLDRLLPPQVAWVQCDNCEKWRCISVELANTLEETDCKWTCKDNMDKAFSDCSIPQEKTDSEINGELGILDDLDDPSIVELSSNGVEPSNLAASQLDSWTPINSNVFLHRTRRTQTIDEIMVCHCKPPQDGHWGCGDQCLNRMLNIECVKGTCPCHDLCSNQQFQNRKYTKFKWVLCGKKGYGLQLQEDVSRGQFLIEYVGEVLDLATFEARLRYHASRGQKHFYFMTINEKWMVNGEVCIGLFAMRDIKKGEEVTFDYNYVRAAGAAAKKCFCGSSACRGYIGGDSLNSEIIVKGDSNKDNAEPAVIQEKAERQLYLKDSEFNTNDTKAAKHEEICVERKNIVFTWPLTIPEPEVCMLKEEDVCGPIPIPEVNILDFSLQSSDPIQSKNTLSRPESGMSPSGDSNRSLYIAQTDENICKPISDIQPHEISLNASTTINKVLSDSVLNGEKSITNLFEEKPNTVKPHSLTKLSRSRGTIERGRSSVKKLVSHNSKSSIPGAGIFEGVEAKLNELLDRDGGISKQKDATRGYLKLLFVTAAEGDVRGCTSQSTRELSLILDAILKTKSRKVLVDVVSKNGLQMLHNIIKQNRGNFSRIPIIRKLLKVLEFLAVTGVLTPELIKKDPPCSGMESFKESILKLTSHSDKQVHKIAREFRDKWIPRHIRRVEPSDRDDEKIDRQLQRQQVLRSRGSDAIVISAGDHLPASAEETTSQQVPISSFVTNNNSASETKTCKQTSWWDHPSDITGTEDQAIEVGPKFMKCSLASSEPTAQREVDNSEELVQVDDEGSPWFEPLEKNHHSQLSSEIALVKGEVSVGHPQEIYLSDMTTSYGIPVVLMQQLGTTETRDNHCNQHWVNAPGMPFHPYPPLPTYPRPKPNPTAERRELPSTLRREQLDIVQTKHRKSVFYGRREIPSTSGQGHVDIMQTKDWISVSNGRREIRSTSGQEQVDIVQTRHGKSTSDGRREIRSTSGEQVDIVQTRHRKSTSDQQVDIVQTKHRKSMYDGRREIPSTLVRGQLDIVQTRHRKSVSDRKPEHGKSVSDGRREISSMSVREQLDIVQTRHTKSVFDGIREIPSTSVRDQLDIVQTRRRKSVFDGRLKLPKNECGKSLNPRLERFWSNKRFCHGFNGSSLSGSSNLLGHARGDFGGGLCAANRVNSKHVSSRFHRPYK